MGLPTPFRRTIRMVALDVDGTLLRMDKRLSRISAAAIAAARQRGVRIVIATARAPRTTLPLHQALGLDTLVINYNGAVIYDPVHRRTLRHLAINRRIVQRIVRAGQRIEPALRIDAELLDQWVCNRAPEPAAVPAPTRESESRIRPDRVGTLDTILAAPVTKLLLSGDSERMMHLAQFVARHYGESVRCGVSERGVLQVMHGDADKAHALAHVAQVYGLAPQQVMAIGDAHNDLGMIRWAGIGVAVANAYPVVQRAADVIVPSNDDEGVAHALQRFVLRDG